MNRIYRIVFNRSLGVLQVVSELASAPKGGTDGDSDASQKTELKSRLLAVAVSVALAVAATLLPMNAHADGGNGGKSGGPLGAAGGAGGTNAAPTGLAGDAGTNINSYFEGGGGGGGAAFLTGGLAGQGAGGGAGGNGGAGGAGGALALIADPGTDLYGGRIDVFISITGGAGGAGVEPSNVVSGHVDGGGGGGGGGGFAVSTPTGDLTVGPSTSLTGGAGGAGAAANNFNLGGYGGGGGGGQGGGGVLMSGAGSTFANAGTVLGGAGGVGGLSGLDLGIGGSGGAGGIGVLFNGSANGSIVNTGTILGGTGGSADAGNGPGSVGMTGAGGVGISGSNLTIINSGTIAGGMSGDGGNQSAAIIFTGGTNTLELDAGSSIGGSVVAVSGGNDTLVLGGLTSAIFNAASIGSQYLNFANFVKTDSHIWTLTGTTNAATPWLVNAGILSISNDASLGATSGVLTLNGGTLETSASISSSRTITLGVAGGGITTDTGTTFTESGNILGSGALTKNGNGTLILAGSTTYTGNTNINGGTLRLVGGSSIASSSDLRLFGAFDISGTSNGASITSLLGGGAGIVNLGAQTLTLTHAKNENFSGVIEGTGSVVLNGGNEIFVGNNTYSGGTLVNNATLAIISDANLGNTSGALTLNGGRLEIVSAVTSTRDVVLQAGGGTFGTGADLSISGVISGIGGLTNAEPGTLTLSAANTYTGDTNVQSGALQLSGGGSIAGNVTVRSEATLGGQGSVAGTVDVNFAASLAPTGTLSIGNLIAEQGSQMNVTLGAPGANFQIPGSGGSVAVGGNLELDGVTLNVTDAGNMGPGIYNLFSYGGSLTENNGGLSLGTTPAGSTLSIQTLTGDKQINLLDTTGLTLNFWNANGQASATQLGGGSGTWSVTSPTWTDANGDVTLAMQPQPGFGIFGGVAGTVTVDNGAGSVQATGLQFASDGYVLNGDALTLVGNGGSTPIIRVGDGSSASAGMTATFDNAVVSTEGLNKTDLGTLVLNGDGTAIAGGATISSGKLVLGIASGSFSITGTTGSAGTTNANGSGTNGGAGGAGVSMASGTGFTNAASGAVLGGAGGTGGDGSYAYVGNGGSGGNGVNGSTNVNMDNSGAITAGQGGQSGTSSPPFAMTTGGVGGIGGAGVALGAGSTLVNHAGGTITGGAGGYSTLFVAGNNPQVVPGSSYSSTSVNGVAGGAGASLGNSSTLINGGAIQGGYGSSGAAAVMLVPAIQISSGSFIATGGNGGTGGAGVALGSGATLTNAGTIFAGNGGMGSSSAAFGSGFIFAPNATTGSLQINAGNGGVGGIGVAMAGSGSFNNQAGGFIGGGVGGRGGATGFTINGTVMYVGNGGDGGDGGDGVVLGDNFANASNAGAIGGGSGGVGGGFATPAFLAGATFVSAGNGGNGGNGAAALVAGLGNFSNTHFIQGGYGGLGGSLIDANNNVVAGGAGGAGGNGGVGVYGTAGLKLSNASGGQILGGYGGNGGSGGYGNGDYNAQTAATAGGVGGAGGQGGASLSLGSGTSFTNAGVVTGGNGGTGGTGGFGAYVSGTTSAAPSGNGGNGGAGGAGVTGAGFTFVNSGNVTGGNGGAGGVGGVSYGAPVTTGNGGNGAAGGAGVSGSSFMLTNTGTITGGAGGLAGAAGSVSAYASSSGALGVDGTGGAGGVGVVSTGGSAVINAGTIAGGLSATGTQADAVNFSGGGNTLVIDAAATFTGKVVSISGNTNGGDTFALGGNTNASFDLGTLGAVGSGAAIQGFNQFGKTGTSTWTLAGTGNASQSWTITNGTLVGNTTSIVGNVTFSPVSGGNANLAFDQSASGMYGGVISGDGSLTKNGSGTLTLTGDNTYTGTTTINGGVLQVANAGTTGMISGNVVNNAAVAFDRADTVTYGAVISGTGSVAQIGSGTLILNGANTYTGGTTVQAGTLEVGDDSHANASIQNKVTVNAGGTLRGHGTIDGDVTSDGMVWPGGSVGVLTINGNYTQNADASLQIDVTPTQASELVVNGNASLAGSLNLIYAPGTYTTKNYTVVQANALSGQFTTTTSSGSVPTALDPKITYSATQVDLSLTAAAPPSTPPSTPPATVVAPRDGSLYANLMRSVSLVGQQSLSTVLGASLRPSAGNCDAGNAIHSNTISTSCGNALWMQYSGSSDSLSGGNGLNSTAFGLQGGWDYAVADVVHVGVEAGFDRINGSDHNGGSGSIDNVHGGVYAFANVGPVVLSGMIDEAHGSYRTTRQTGVGHGVANPDGNTTAAALQAAWPLTAAQWQITPAVGALYQHQSLDAFEETVRSTSPLASAFAVEGAHASYNTMQPYAQVSFTRSFVAQGVSYVPQFQLGYRYDTRNGNAPVVRAMAQDGTVFAMPGDNLGRGVATVGVRLTARSGASWNVYLDYRGQFASHLSDNALSVGFTRQF